MLAHLQVMPPLKATLSIKDPEEQIAARKALIQPGGKVKKKMDVVEALVGAITTPFYCGERMTLADFQLFVFMGMLRSGCDTLCCCILYHLQRRVALHVALLIHFVPCLLHASSLFVYATLV
jgi:glutathione S-transferase